LNNAQRSSFQGIRLFGGSIGVSPVRFFFSKSAKSSLRQQAIDLVYLDCFRVSPWEGCKSESDYPSGRCGIDSEVQSRLRFQPLVMLNGRELQPGFRSS
jgi:hypothetical protein